MNSIDNTGLSNRCVMLEDLWDEEIDEHAEWLSNKREDAALALTGMLHHLGISRADLARTLGWKPSRVTRALSGNENLTLNTLAEIIGAGGLDFDIRIRERSERRAFQPWEEMRIAADILDVHAKVTTVMSEVEILQRRAEASLNTLAGVSRAMFRQAASAKKATDGRQWYSSISTADLTYNDDEELQCANG